MNDDHQDATPDRVAAARERLAQVDDLALGERADVFAEVNAALVAELNDMEEV